jgi:hypothetical protein
MHVISMSADAYQIIAMIGDTAREPQVRMIRAGDVQVQALVDPHLMEKLLLVFGGGVISEATRIDNLPELRGAFGRRMPQLR